jgi:hypothetical protein
MSPTRRQVLRWGAGAAGAAVSASALAGAGGYLYLKPPQPRQNLAPLRDLAEQLFEMLDDSERTRAVFDYDHPLRQYHNRGVETGGAWAIDLHPATRQMIVDVMYSGLSQPGRDRIPKQFVLDWTGLHSLKLAIMGDPRNPPYQILITGAHLNLRLGGRSREGVAFGGPQVYGDQEGNRQIGLPGNAYRDQLELGQQLWSDLSRGERKAARQSKAPVQTAIELRGPGGGFSGVAVADLGRKRREQARGMVAAMLETYGEDDVAYAWECIEHNGGVDAMHLSDYSEDHEPGHNFGEGPSQIFRLEGPASVLHYRGTPHLHAFINIAMDGKRPLSIGEVVAENPRAMDAKGVKALFEDVLLRETGADLSYYPLDKVAGPLRAGTIRTGDIYSLESWKEFVSVSEVKGSELNETLVSDSRLRERPVQSNKLYRVATARYVANNFVEKFIGVGVDESETSGVMLRDVSIAHLQKEGFGTAV